MPLAYSIDLRRRVVSAVIRHNKKPEQVAEEFEITSRTVRRWVEKKEKTGEIEPKPRSGGRPASLGVDDYELVKKVVNEFPDATYPEIQNAFNQQSKRNVSYAVIVRAVLKLGYTRKKNSL